MRTVTEDAQEAALARWMAGDTAAFAEIVREHQAMVYSLALHFLRDPATAEDVAQEVFLELYRNGPSLKSAAHVRLWLHRVACHRSIDRARRRRRQTVLSLDDAPEPATVAPPEDPLLRERLRRLVQSLPEKPRMALILRYQEGLTVREIAEAMGMPVNSAKSSLERALALLREKLARTGQGVEV